MTGLKLDSYMGTYVWCVCVCVCVNRLVGREGVGRCLIGCLPIGMGVITLYTFTRLEGLNYNFVWSKNYVKLDLGYG